MSTAAIPAEAAFTEEIPATAPVAVSADHLVRRYGDGDTAVDALRGVSLDVADGRLTAIMGPSGSGKSTLMHILAGLDRPSSGTVRLDGVELTGLSDKKLTLLRREKIGFVFQFFNLLPMLNAEENVVLPLTIATPRTIASAVRTARTGRPARPFSETRITARSPPASPPALRPASTRRCP